MVFDRPTTLAGALVSEYLSGKLCMLDSIDTNDTTVVGSYSYLRMTITDC